MTLDSTTVQQYTTGRQHGAINPDQGGQRLVVRNISAVRNYWAGLNAAANMKILGGHYNDNDQGDRRQRSHRGRGRRPGRRPGHLRRTGASPQPHLHASCDWEAGGIKWDVGWITFATSTCTTTTSRPLGRHQRLRRPDRHNLIEDNCEEGIFYEISQDAVIRNNQVHGNGLDGRGW